jgi:4'-phosphopantetheinyl transferase
MNAASPDKPVAAPREESPLLPPPGEIHLLLTRLSTENGREPADSILSPDELARAGRLLRQDVRHRFIAGRTFLRRNLGHCLGRNPAGINLATNQWGKPYLGGEQAESGLRFNLSHTHDWAILALALGTEVGVDLELISENVEFRPMALYFFSPREREELTSLPEGEQRAAFYRCWTRKESYLKGVGRGFSLPPDSFHVSLLPDHPPALLGHRTDPGEPERWSLADLPLPPGLCGAVAMEGRIRAVRLVD